MTLENRMKWVICKLDTHYPLESENLVKDLQQIGDFWDLVLWAPFGVQQKYRGTKDVQ